MVSRPAWQLTKTTASRPSCGLSLHASTEYGRKPGIRTNVSGATR